MGESPQLRGLAGVVREALDAHLGAGSHVAVAVSGGSDSVALLRLVHAARPDLELVVAHVRHGLRDDSADALAARDNARHLGVAHVELNVRPMGGAGPEDAARRARLDALVGLARDRGLDAVLLGHTGDDQAETLLLRIARGTGPDGLAGIRPRSVRDGVPLLRPLLGLRRAAVRQVAAGWPTVEDPTNADPDQRRARARHEALPALGRLRPDAGDAVPALMRLADLAAAQADAWDHMGGGWPVSRFGACVVVEVRPPHGAAVGPAVNVQRARGLRKGWGLLPGEPTPPPRAVIQRLVGLSVGEVIDVPGGVRGHRLDHAWVLQAAVQPRLPTNDLMLDQMADVPGHGVRYRLSVPMDPAVLPVVLDDTDPATAQGRGGAARPAWTARFEAPRAGPAGLCVRGRRPEGDRAARRALQAYPVPLRDHVPLIASADGEIFMVDRLVLLPPRPGRQWVRVEAFPSRDDDPATFGPAGDSSA